MGEEGKPQYVSRLEIKKLLHDATWGSTEPTREDVIEEFIDRLAEGDIHDTVSFKISILRRKF